MSPRSEQRARTARRLASLAVVFALAAGCAQTRQLRGEPAQTGFLGDYSKLAPGGDDRAKLV